MNIQKIKQIDIYEPDEKTLIHSCAKNFLFPERRIDGKKVDNTLMIKGKDLPVLLKGAHVVVYVKTKSGGKFEFSCSVEFSGPMRMVMALAPQEMPETERQAVKTVQPQTPRAAVQGNINKEKNARDDRIGKIKKIEIYEHKAKTPALTFTKGFFFPEKEINGIAVDNMLMIKGKNLPVFAKGALINVIIYTRGNDRFSYFCQIDMSTPHQINIMLQSERARKLEEQRRFYKVQTEINCRVSEFMRDEEVSVYNPPLFARILDLNLGGIFISFFGGDEYDKNDIITVVINLENNVLEIMAKILRIQKDPDGEIRGYGCSFVAISPQQEALISRYVNNLQIEALRAEKEREIEESDRV